MSELFIELFSEEIPARMQGAATENLQRLITEQLNALNPQHVKTFSTPRRIAIRLDINPSIPAQKTEERGPRLNAPEKALEGFLRKHQAQHSDLTEQNGFWVLQKNIPERPAVTFIQETLPQILWNFPWPKSQRWGSGSLFTWVRPLHHITCILDEKIIPFSLARSGDDAHQLHSGNISEGHRFLAPEIFTVNNANQWQQTLLAHHVIADPQERREKILGEITQLAMDHTLELVQDDGLLNEVTGLVEWPVAFLGKIDPVYMDLPQEVMQVSMRVNQRYFALKNQDGTPAAYFAFIANIIPENNDGSLIIAGNERVLRARFADARYFWNQDRKISLEQRNDQLKSVIFHAKLGSQYERVERLVKIAGYLAGALHQDIRLAERAALLCKADLTTGMVGEFPEVQGIMGGYYARHDQENAQVAQAIQEHYKPSGPSDQTPTAPLSIITALADKIDLLTAFFAINEKPKGSGDPYALRRAALGIIRIIRENALTLDLLSLFDFAIQTLPASLQDNINSHSLSRFINERLYVQLRSEGLRYDILSAVTQHTALTDISETLEKVNAITRLIDTSEGQDLLAAVKRAGNILRIEAKKDGPHEGNVNPQLLQQDEEKNLYHNLEKLTASLQAALDHKEFEQAMNRIAALRMDLDTFFDKVIINDPVPEIRKNRLTLLAKINQAASLIADFSQIEK